MKLLIKSTLILATLFLSTFIVIKFTGLLTVEDIEAMFETLKSQPSYLLGGVVILLLFADLFIAIPTMTVILLAGFFIGYPIAPLFVFIGLLLAAFTGYFLSRLWGEKLLRKIEPDENQIIQMQTLFDKHGMLVLILSRAIPILPEVSACLAGASKMPFSKFVLGWSLGTIPYLLIVTYSGSISDINNPFPAILTAIAVTTTLWFTWAWFLHRKMRTKSAI